MAGDYTRLTFDPLRDRAMVLEQQGRVHLDADFNELVSILERRLRVETRDFTGPAVAPAALPHSFEIKLSGSKLTIDPGRMYVDGLLAENHGYGAPVHEPVWDEPGFAGATPIDKQPYLGSPVPSTVDGDVVVYLDVWQREETAVEDPSLVESALGVDTCTRVQTAWQVRTLEIGDKPVTCADAVPGYPPPLSAGRLTSQAADPPKPSDPCAVAPVGGYRGLENRLYRVEVHDAGGAGKATFKWSRDNGAVAARVLAVDDPAKPQIITVERLGRDQVLRFHQNEWVELLDDTHELDGQPGLMGQVQQVDSTENTVTLATALGGAIDPKRNPRLRRWDQFDGVNAQGTIPIAALPSAFFALEDGVQVKFELSAAGGTLATGDWWVFAARAATASIEELAAAPPRGIRHHYARLAVIQGGQVTDCREIFPGTCEGEGGCECTACVTPASHKSGELTLQAAIDKVVPTGGRVCVAPGHYVISEPLVIARARALTFAGAGTATLITYDGDGGTAMLVESSVEVSLERFALAATGPHGQATVGITLANTAACRVERCLVLVGLIPGVRESARLHADDVGIGLSGWVLRTRLLENVIAAATAVGDLTNKRSGPLAGDATGGIELGGDPYALMTVARAAKYRNGRYLATLDLGIVDNLLLGARAGIDFAGGLAVRDAASETTLHLGMTRIADNLVLGCSTAGIMLFGLGATQSQAPGAAPPSATGATGGGLDVPALVGTGTAGIAVTGNVISVVGDGIRATSGALRIADNQIVTSSEPAGKPTTGVLLPFAREVLSGHALVTGNLVRGFGFGGVISIAGLGALTVAGNTILDAGTHGIGIAALWFEAAVTIAENTIIGVGVADQPATVHAIAVLVASDARIAGNVIRQVGVEGWQGKLLYGIYLGSCWAGHVSGNVLTEIGPEDEHAGWVQGIGGYGIRSLDVRGNSVTLGTGGRVSRDLPLMIGKPPIETPDLLGLHLLLFGHEMFQPIGGAAAAAAQGHDPVPANAPDVAVHGNTLYGYGRTPVALIETESNVLLAENRCVRRGEPAEAPIVLIRTTGATIVSSNRVEGARHTPSRAVDLHVNQAAGSGIPHCTVLGNIADGPIEINDTPLAAPWAPLNIIA